MEKIKTSISSTEKNNRMAPSRIVHVAAYFPPHIGGLERVVERAATHLAKTGANVLVLTSRCATGRSKIAEKTEYEVKRLWAFEFMHTPWAPTLFFQLLFTKHVAVFHIHLPHAYWSDIARLVAWMRRKPYVAHFHIDVNVSGKLRFLLRMYKKLTWGPFLRGAARVITCSEAMAERVIERYGVDPNRISIVPNAVDADFFQNIQRDVDRTPLRLLSIGRITPQKKIERLIEAMSLLTVPATLTVVGDGEERVRMEALASERLLKNINFVGFKNDKEMQQCHREHDIFLISSSHEGGTPLVVLEAMAAGLPVIGSDGEGVRDILEGVGIVVTAPYAQGFASAIDSVWKDKERRVALSEASRTYALRHTWDAFVVALAKIYKDVTGI